MTPNNNKNINIHTQLNIIIRHSTNNDDGQQVQYNNTNKANYDTEQ